MNFLFRITRMIYHQFLLQPYYNKILGKFGKDSKLAFSTKLENPKNIHIGNRVSIGRMSWLAANPLTTNLYPKLIIGDGTYIGNFAHIYCTSRIEIGTNVLFADKVYISDNLHSYTNIDLPVTKQHIKQIDEVLIGDGSWIGENVCIIGTSIGKHSIIGANSVVNKSIPDYSVAVGSPAKIIKRYSFEKQDWLKTDAKGNFIEL